MKHLRIPILTMLSILMLMGAFAAAPSAQNDRARSQPFEGFSYNPCKDENIAITGRVIFEFDVMEDGSGGSYTVLQSHLVGTGVGLVSGAKYVVSDHTTATLTETAAGVDSFTFPFNIKVIALDGDVPDLFAHLLFHLTINANGEVS